MPWMGRAGSTQCRRESQDGRLSKRYIMFSAGADGTESDREKGALRR